MKRTRHDDGLSLARGGCQRIPTTASLFRRLGLDELKEVVAFLDGRSLGCLEESGCVGGDEERLLRRWWKRWRRNAALGLAFEFLDPGDLGPLVAAYFVDDPVLARAAHERSCEKLRRYAARLSRRSAPFPGADDLSLFI